ncbi:hypothetical protein Ddye_009027 [Dipteronia dyeriana]|uniref:Uncharacterized protein n=1 Tax=Dipteronia dyeriana TaxID=168575 RepID=A0AAE0CLV9_9ROSI|nr:hypothetical protein Ddye_009027 [Dipteronia dyeriana]
MVAITASLMPDRLPLTTVVCIPNSINAVGIVTFDSIAKMTIESMLARIIEVPTVVCALLSVPLSTSWFIPESDYSNWFAYWIFQRPKLGPKHSGPPNPVKLHHLCQPVGPGHFGPLDLVQLYLLRRSKLRSEHSGPLDLVQIHLLHRPELEPYWLRPDHHLPPSKLRFPSLDLPMFTILNINKKKNGK